MSRYLSLLQIGKSIKNLESVHPFFGITFLVCKVARLPVGETIEFQLDAANKEFLEKYYKLDRDSDWYFRVFRPSDKNKSWVAGDYASSGLQSVNTRTFGDAFIHSKNSDIWGWHPQYVSRLTSHLSRRRRISAFDLGVWLFRDWEWPNNATADSVVNRFFDEFSINDDERTALFDYPSIGSLLDEGMFDDRVVSWQELRTLTGAPPDARPTERVATYFEVSLSNIRSFVGRNAIPIKPLTLLVGDNSSGKTTLMAAVSALCNPAFPMWVGLNEAPYNLGGYDAIASFDKSGEARNETFSIGYKVKGKAKEDSASIIAVYGNNRGKVQLAHLEIHSSAGQFQMSLDEQQRDRYQASIFSRSKSKPKKSLEGYVRRTDDYAKADLPTFIVSNWESLVGDGSEKRRRRAEFVELLLNISNFLNPPKTLSVAPIRTKPKRTYDEISDLDFIPEGAHIPYVLARILTEDISGRQKQILLRSLEQYGKESGLFCGIRINQLGDNISAPFQILVDPSGVPTNLLDVGYGVSQALPIVVQSVLLDAPKLLLLQQPEVHLHPKAQAALGSFFSKLVQEDERQFVIETHSDFIVDRIRQEVAAGHLKPELVQILFFDKPGIKTNVYVLELDSAGNILHAPANYRNFFLREELNLISRTGGSD